jgi:hypothetical protein
MPISRMQMPRQLRRGGGIMNVAPRQGYFLGGIGDAIKGIGKGIKSAAKGIVSTIKDNPALALAAFNFAPMLAGAKPFIGMGSLAGSKYTIPGLSGLSSLGGEKTLGTTAKVFLGGSLLGGVLGEMSPEEQAEVTSGRNIGALRTKLTNAYKNQRTFADTENEDTAIAEQVENDLAEYTSGAGGYADGGRIGYQDGTDFEKYLKGREKFNKEQNAEQLYREFLENKRRQKIAEQKTMAANGGRIGYAMGSDELVNQASGIMGLPQRTNKAGVKELDLRESGGFIPPVGVKEKADDIPAMLSNNEFVFTADAVRGMGNGNVNKGAQRMYDMMKKLEKGGRV